MLQQTRNTRKQTARERELFRLHAAARALGLDETSRRSVYLMVAGERSAALFSAAQRQAVIKFLETELAERERAAAPVRVSDEEALDILGLAA